MAVGGAEVLLDDTLRFAEAAAAAGVKVQTDVYDNLPHAFAITMLDGDTLFLDRVAAWIG